MYVQALAAVEDEREGEHQPRRLEVLQARRGAAIAMAAALPLALASPLDALLGLGDKLLALFHVRKELAQTEGLPRQRQRRLQLVQLQRSARGN